MPNGIYPINESPNAAIVVKTCGIKIIYRIGSHVLRTSRAILFTVRAICLSKRTAKISIVKYSRTTVLIDTKHSWCIPITTGYSLTCVPTTLARICNNLGVVWKRIASAADKSWAVKSTADRSLEPRRGVRLS